MAMTAAERKRKQRNRDIVEPENVTLGAENVTKSLTDVTKCHENVTLGGVDVTKCTHPLIIPVTKANRHLSYSKIGASLPDRQPEVIETKMVACPCCGKEWLCKRPDIQSPYCLQCERGVVGLSWREQEPYVRPPYEDRSKAMQALR